MTTTDEKDGESRDGTERFRCFVALGDSQTEGVGDPTGPGGRERGWADRFVENLAGRQDRLLYANLAVRGRLIGQVEEQQIEPALAMEPDLVSLVAGLNDVLRPGCDLDRVLATMDRMQARLVASGATVLTLTYPDPTLLMPVGRYLADRFRAFNQGLRDVAGRNRVRLLDVEPVAAAADPRIWTPDRLHLNPSGHQRLANGMLSLLEADPEPGAWMAGLPPAAPVGPVRSTARELRWAGAFLTPWIWRRLRGRSSGDGRVARRPIPLPAESPATRPGNR